MAILTPGQPSIPARNAKSAALRLSETCVFGGADGDGGAAGCCDAGGEAGGGADGGADGGAAQETRDRAKVARVARVGGRKSGCRIGRGREWEGSIGAILYESVPSPADRPGRAIFAKIPAENQALMRKLNYSLAVLLLFVSEKVTAQEYSGMAPQWRASLESDIKNGASPAHICETATGYANSSSYAPFKDWAYGVARDYCSTGNSGKIQPSPSSQTSKVSSGCRFPTDADIKKAAKGIRVDLSRGCCIFIANPNRQDKYRW